MPVDDEFTDRYPGTVRPNLGDLPGPLISRLPLYLRWLNQLQTRGVEFVSSHNLGAGAGVSSAVARKDLSAIGQLGRRGKGYPVQSIHQAIAQVLGITEHQKVILIGAGNLGTALVDYDGFAARHLELVGVFDNHPKKIGTMVGSFEIQPLQNLSRVASESEARLAILTVPAAAAQPIVDEMVDAGITGILNFAPVDLEVPDHVAVRMVDLSAELQILAFRNMAH